ncbi:MFS transporter [Enterococcus lactis]|uniref:MFS transporter n=1 Tax=Enterococcus lactis TaxID=357441 RepID=UPI0039A7368D
MEKKERQNSIMLISSRSISRIGDIMFDFANNTFLASMSPKSLSLVGTYQILENIISVVFNLFGGVIADRFRRKKIIIAADSISGIICIGLSLIGTEKWLIYAVVIANVILAFLNSFSAPSYKAFTKEIVEKKNISSVNSYLETASTIIKVAIPLVAVSLYRWLGIHGVLLLDGISFLASGVLLLFISPIIEEVASKEKFSLTTIGRDLKSGFSYLFNQKQILIIIILSALVNFFLAAYNLLLPYSNQMFPEISKQLYGIFLAAEAVGGLIGASVSSTIKKEITGNRLLMSLGLSGISLSISPVLYYSFYNSIILSLSPAFFSLFLTIFNIQFFSFIQREVDNGFLGRIFGIVFTIAILFMPIGTGIFAIILRPSYTYNLSLVGLAVIVLSLLFGYLLRKYQSSTE